MLFTIVPLNYDYNMTVNDSFIILITVISVFDFYTYFLWVLAQYRELIRKIIEENKLKSIIKIK